MLGANLVVKEASEKTQKIARGRDTPTGQTEGLLLVAASVFDHLLPVQCARVSGGFTLIGLIELPRKGGHQDRAMR